MKNCGDVQPDYERGDGGYGDDQVQTARIGNDETSTQELYVLSCNI